MDNLSLDALTLVFGVGFHTLFASIILTFGWVLLLFAGVARAYPGRGWGQAFEFWTQVLTLTFALWAVSGLSLWLQPGQPLGPWLPLLLLAGLALPTGLLGLLLRGRHLLTPEATIAVVFVLAGYLTVCALHEPAWGAVAPPSDSIRWQGAAAVAQSAAVSGALLMGLSALRGLFGDNRREVRLGLGTGAVLSLAAGTGLFALAALQSGTLATAARPEAALVAVYLLATALVLRGTLRGSAPLAPVHAAALTGLCVAVWLGFTLRDTASFEQAMGDNRAIGLPSFLTYALLYSGLTAAYMAGLALMAQRRALTGFDSSPDRHGLSPAR